jgi:hypothetical protein
MTIFITMSENYVSLVVAMLWEAYLYFNQKGMELAHRLAPAVPPDKCWNRSTIILHLGTRQRWVVSFMSLQFYPQGKSRRYPLDRTTCGPHSWSGRRREEKKPCPCRESKFGGPGVPLYRFSQMLEYHLKMSQDIFLPLTNSRELSPSWEAVNCAPIQQFTYIL